MLMWYIILIIVIIATGAGLFYMESRLEKFAFMDKIAQGNPKRKKTISMLSIIAVFAILSLTVNMLNAVVCLLHFAVIWALCDTTFGIIQKLRKRPFQHYYSGTLATVLSLAALITGWQNAHQVQPVFYTIKTEKDVEPLRIIQFADSHIGTTFDENGFAAHLTEMQKYNPDIILIAGDFVDDDTTRPQMIAATRALGKLRIPNGIYYAHGNHDKGYHDPKVRGFSGNDLINELKKNNVRILQDESVIIKNTFHLVGRQDASEILRGSTRKNMKELMQNLDKNKYIIVMDHQPNDYQNQTDAKADLVLSGHTHGGQLFPLNKVGEWIGANDRTYGHERRRLTDFIVTSGLSDWNIKFKTGTQSEFVVIDIYSR